MIVTLYLKTIILFEKVKVVKNLEVCAVPGTQPTSIRSFKVVELVMRVWEPTYVRTVGVFPHSQ